MILLGHAAVPGWFGQYRLKHAGVHIDERGLKETQGQCRYLLLVNAVGRHFTALAEEDEAVGAVPVLHDIQTFMDFPAEGFLPKVTA